MARGRRSLRGRMRGAFLALAVALGPLMAGVVLLVSHELEEHTVEQRLFELLEQVVGTPEAYTLREIERDGTTLRVLQDPRDPRIPPGIHTLEDGLHEYEQDGTTWMVAASSGEDARYVVTENITAMEAREDLSGITVVAGVLLSGVLALSVGGYIAQRLVAPLTRLAERVERLDGSERLESGFHADDEVARLARALDYYRDELDRRARREAQFAAHASHELRNPIAVIQSAAELLDEDPALGDRSRRAAARIRSTTRRMGETVTALLVLMRGAEDQKTQCIPLGACIDGVLADEAVLFSATDGPGPVLERRDAVQGEEAPVVEARPGVPEIILRNLIRNALTHAAASRIEVVLHEDRVEVVDDGCGMDPADLDGNHAGGLGLALIRRLCDHAGWRFRVFSSPGEGTRAEWAFSRPDARPGPVDCRSA